MTTHVFFDPDSIDWASFLNRQEGRGKYFIGTRYQRGHGILSNIARFVLPIAKNIAATAGREGLAAGTRILSDISEGKDIKETLKTQSQKGLENLATKFQQCGKGKKKKPKSIVPIKTQRRYIDQLTYI